MLSITHNRAIDRLRTAAIHERHRAAEEEQVPDTAVADAFSQVSSSDQRAQIKGALDELPAEQRRVIELGYFGGYTHVEISDLLDVPLGTVKARMRLGLQKMRDGLAPSLLAGA
jgi:RNA polymerase sigma-70 factor (ECF subfamily)